MLLERSSARAALAIAQTRCQIVNACISSNGGAISTNMNAMLDFMKQCEGKDDLVSRGADIGLDTHCVEIANAIGRLRRQGGFV